MKCEFCFRGMSTGDTLFRINPTGVKGVWACRAHRPQTDAPIYPGVEAIVAIIEEDNEKT